MRLLAAKSWWQWRCRELSMRPATVSAPKISVLFGDGWHIPRITNSDDTIRVLRRFEGQTLVAVELSLTSEVRCLTTPLLRGRSATGYSGCDRPTFSASSLGCICAVVASALWLHSTCL